MDSAMKLRNSIEDLLGLERKTILVSKISGEGGCRGNTVILRYGCSWGNLEKEPSWGNKHFTDICIDKMQTSEKFRDIIRTPIFINDTVPTEYPVVIRESLTSNQSQGLHIVHNEKEFRDLWQDHFYWTKYFEHDSEIRVNAVFLEDSMHCRIYKKIPKDNIVIEGEFVPGEGGNDNSNWVLKYNTDYPKVIRILKTMKERVLDLKGKFVGIDMIYCPEFKDYVVLELNSGPWLTKLTCDWLARIFLEDTKKEFSWKY
jgi:hypothetical protein